MGCMVLIHSPFDGHLVCFHVWATVNHAAVGTFSCLGQLSWSGIADNCVTSGQTLHTPQQCTWVQSLCILTDTCYCVLFVCSHPSARGAIFFFFFFFTFVKGSTAEGECCDADYFGLWTCWLETYLDLWQSLKTHRWALYGCRSSW